MGYVACVFYTCKQKFSSCAVVYFECNFLFVFNFSFWFCTLVANRINDYGFSTSPNFDSVLLCDKVQLQSADPFLNHLITNIGYWISDAKN